MGPEGLELGLTILKCGPQCALFPSLVPPLPNLNLDAPPKPLSIYGSGGVCFLRVTPTTAQ